MSLDDAEELRVRAELLALIAKAEAGAKWTDLEELRERAELLGGTFEVRSRPGDGTAVLAYWPLSARAAL